MLSLSSHQSLPTGHDFVLSTLKIERVSTNSSRSQESQGHFDQIINNHRHLNVLFTLVFSKTPGTLDIGFKKSALLRLCRVHVTKNDGHAGG